MSVDYIVSSLPTLSLDQPAPMTWERFVETAGESVVRDLDEGLWRDLETQLRNAVAEARGGDRYRREAEGCSLYWKNRVLACFQERDPLKREEALDRVWWDAAGELVPPASPLGKDALAAYAVRLRIALKRSAVSREAGNAAFDRLTSATKKEF